MLTSEIADLALRMQHGTSNPGSWEASPPIFKVKEIVAQLYTESSPAGWEVTTNKRVWLGSLRTLESPYTHLESITVQATSS